MHRYHDAQKRLPPAFAPGEPKGISYSVSIHVHLLPYIGEESLYKTFEKDGRGDNSATIYGFIADEDGSVTEPAGVQTFAANLRVFSTKGIRTKAAGDMPPLRAEEPGNLKHADVSRGISNTIMFTPKLATSGEGGSRFASHPTSPYAAFVGQNVAHSTAHYSNPRSIYQWAPSGEECLTRPLMAQHYPPTPIGVLMGDATARLFPGETGPGFWNAFMHPLIEACEE